MKLQKLFLALLSVGLTAACASAQVSITTADGNGADAGIHNDGNKSPDYVNAATSDVEIRNYSTVRAKALLVRFDVSSLYGVDLSDAVFSMTGTAARARSFNVWGLVDGDGDLWDESTMCYNNCPSVTTNPDNSSDAYGINLIEPDWSVLGTFTTTQSTAYVVHSGTIDGLADFIAADTNGVITLLIFPVGSENFSYYIRTKEGSEADAASISFPNAKGASLVSPEYGEVVLPTLSNICWTNPEPNDVENGIITSDIYLGTDEPNLYKPNYNLNLIESDYSGTCLDISDITLTEGIYYWRVVSHDSSFTSDYYSPFFKFEVTDAPIIDVQPVSTGAKIGAEATFTITAHSSKATHYYWYYSADDIADTSDTAVGTNSDTLTISNITIANKGYYYCAVTNNGDAVTAVTSDIVELDIYREIAHWSFDELVSGVFEDTTGEGHDATPLVDPNFTTGVSGQALDTRYGAACNAGTWIPTEETGMCSVAVWVNRYASGAMGIFAKSDAYAADSQMFQFGTSAGGSLFVNRSGGTYVYGYGLPVLNTWELLILTIDSNNSVANIHQLRNSNVHILVDSRSKTFTLGTGTASSVVIGLSSSTATDYFNGALDEISVFNYVLDEKEMIDYYNDYVAGNFCYLEYGDSEVSLDTNNNCIIDMADFAAIANAWLECGLYPNCPQ